MPDPNPDAPEVIETPAPAPEVEVDDIEEDLEPEVPGTPPANETPEQKDARIQKLEERNSKLWARLQRQKNKPASPAAPAAPAPTPTVPAPATPGLTREEGILFAKGFTEAEVEQAKKVAALQGVKLTDAVADPLFTGWKAIEDKKAKDAAAQLPASRGGKPVVKRTLGSKGLSDAEHEELYKEKFGR